MTLTNKQQTYIYDMKTALNFARENINNNLNTAQRGLKAALWYFNKLNISLIKDESERFSKNFMSQAGQIYIEAILYPQIQTHLKESKTCIDDPEHKKILDYWYDCNAFRLQLEELYKQHQEDQTDTPKKYTEIEIKIKQLVLMGKKLERAMN